MRYSLVEVNGQPAIAAATADLLDSVGVLAMDDGRITELYLIRNPAKLARIGPDRPPR